MRYGIRYKIKELNLDVATAVNDKVLDKMAPVVCDRTTQDIRRIVSEPFNEILDIENTTILRESLESDFRGLAI